MFVLKILLFFNFLLYTSAFRLGDIECDEEPQHVAFSTLSCSSSGGCKLECKDGYKFPRGEKVLELNCLNRRIWGARSYGNLIPDCESTCTGGCRNGGKCVAPNVCSCNEGFSGSNCEARLEVCPDTLPMPQNTMGKCVTTSSGKVKTCKVTCIEGYKFPDGSLTSDILCRNGRWSLEPRNFDKCEPVCNPRCMNGGTCVAPNLCQCTSDFRGSACQYSTERCSPKRIGFNGIYKCTGTHEKMDCRLSCPSGYYPQYPLASVYSCRYDEGVFQPQRVPMCDYRGALVQITHA